MNLRINICRPSFGVVTQSAINLAKSNCEKDIEKLIVSQEDNKKYNVTVTDADQKTAKKIFGVSKYPGRIIKTFPTLLAACFFASTLENADKKEKSL